MHEPEPNVDLGPLYSDHPRSWRENLYVYPVVSRRSGGLSIGVNLNPDKACNFDCIYCQVDRTAPPVVHKVEPERLRIELEATVRAAVLGTLFESAPFNRVPEANRTIRDIAFSGDGEPTTSPHFPAAVRIAAEVRRSFGLDDTAIVLITNAAYLHRPAVRDALAVLDTDHGEIWAKLDAGTAEYFQRINRPNVPFDRVLNNILEAARARPIVIQSLWMSISGQRPTDTEIDAFASRLRDIIQGGGAIRLVQVYTTARRPAERSVAPLSNQELESIAGRIRAVVGVPVATYGT